MQPRQLRRGAACGNEFAESRPPRRQQKRRAPGRDKPTFVIDFANDAGEILAAFKTFYRDAKVSDVQDPNVVYDIKASLDAAFLYEQAEVQAVAQAVVDPAVSHQKLYSLTQAPADRFNTKLKALTGAIDAWERAWKARLPTAAVHALFEAMTTHQTLAKRLLGDAAARDAFVDVVYEVLLRGDAGGLIAAARPPARERPLR